MDGSVLRVAVVGLGDIAEKAYLPVLAARPDVRLTLVTRNIDTLARLEQEYAVDACTTRLSDLLGSDADGAPDLDAAFVHAATEAHAELVEPLLDAGVPVLVDKPLAPDLAGAERLVRLAEQRQVSLMVGFNRRFAPAYAALAGLAPSVTVMQKHRVDQPDAPRRFVFDDFIHVADTLRWLLPTGSGEEPDVSVWCAGAEGLLRTVTVSLRTERGTAVGVMHRDGGLDHESLEVLGSGFQHRVVDLSEEWWAEAGGAEGMVRAGRDGWAPVPTVRGFDAMCEHFLSAVRTGEVLSARDALETHALCEQVVGVAEAAVTR